MAKSELYSWRTSPETRDELESEAQQHGVSVATIVDRAVTEWLNKRSTRIGDKQVQAQLHAAAARAVGSIRGSNPRRAENAGLLVRKKLERRRAG